MDREPFSIIFGPNMTDKDRNETVSSVLDKLEKEGYCIVAAEPIEKIHVETIGQRFIIKKK